MLRRPAYSSVLLFQRFTLSAFITTSLLLSGCGSGVVGSVVGGTPPSATPPQNPSAVSNGPQLGYIWSDKTQTLRPVLGVPGASQLGQSVVPAGAYVNAATSSATGYALLQETDGALDLIALPSGQPTRLPATLAPGAQLRFSPSGQTAIAFLHASATVTLISNLTSAPKVATVQFPAAAAEAAVSDTGTVAAAIAQNPGLQIRTISSTGVSNLAASAGTLGGLAFTGTGDDLLVADATSNTLTLVRNSASAPAAATLPTAALLNAPAAVGASRDGHYAIIANSGDANIVRIDLTALTPPQRFSCLCQPALVAPLAGAAAFRVTAADTGPAWMIDASTPTPRVLFIPAASLTGTPAATIAFSPASITQEAKK